MIPKDNQELAIIKNRFASFLDNGSVLDLKRIILTQPNKLSFEKLGLDKSYD